jgi:single-stranded DNA-binding protein
MLNLSFAGTVGRDPETRAAGSSDVTEFSVAVNGYDRRAKAKTTTWLKVNIWGERGRQLAGLIEKGSRVAGSGQFEVQTYTNRDGEVKTNYVVTCTDITVQSFKEKTDEAPRARSKAPAKAAGPQQDFPDDDDVPF